MDHDKESMENPYSSINKSMQYPSLKIAQHVEENSIPIPIVLQETKLLWLTINASIPSVDVK